MNKLTMPEYLLLQFLRCIQHLSLEHLPSDAHPCAYKSKLAS